MLVVAEPAPPARAQALVEDPLAGVAEGRVAEVVAEPDRLREVLVQAECARDAPRDPARLERVREPGAVMVALRRDENLRLVLEPPERLRVDDPVAVALERRPVVGVRLRLVAHGRVRASGERGQRLVLEPLDPLPERGSGELGHAAFDSVTSFRDRLEARAELTRTVRPLAPMPRAQSGPCTASSSRSRARPCG